MARSVAWAITYLTLRTVLNGLRRLLASPLRALLALAIVGYLAYDEVGELLESSPDPETAQLLLGGLSAQEQVQGLVAIAVLLHGWFLVFRIAPAALNATRGVVHESDVDYLFATPLPSLRLFWGLAQARAAEQRAESDPYGAYLQARAGRLADRRLRTPAGFTRWTPRSARALLWGEWLTAWRAHALGMALALFSMTLAPPLAAGLLPALVRLAAAIEADSAAGAGDWARLESQLARTPQAQRVAQRYAFVGAQAVSAVVAALGAYWGFVYALRRAAERKALPVPLRTQATMLALSPALPFAGVQLAAALLARLWLPHDAHFWLASSATAATGALALMTAMLTVALILPTASSTVQHFGRRWLMGVVLALSGVWGLVFWLLGALAPELLALACGANLLVALALTRWNGRLYAQYCPTD
ncbi:MAG: putative ABC exporter domain-containing protein [Armatimonadetes bacterium]|nr:putative ABC exporter domain-containing protein [Armatimonadota bacterium]